MNNKVNHQNLLKGLLMLLAILFLMPQGTQAQNYTLGGNYVKFQKFVQPNPDEAAQYVVTTEAAAGETVTASIDPDKIPQGKYFTGVYTSQDVTLTTDWDGATFTMPAKNVTINAVLANQQDYTIDLTKSTSAVISEEISTLLSYMEVGGKNCSVYDKDYNWFLDLNVDGTPDLEVKSTFDATSEKNIFSIEQLSGDGVYKNTCSFALNVTPFDRYKSLTFKFKEVVPVRTLQAGWITLSGDSFTYDGTEHKPAVTVVDGNTSVAVTLEYSKNRDAGEATVTVTANAENYTGSVTKTFTISPKPVTIRGVKAKDKVYDGTTAAEIDAGSATIDGKVEGDELTVNAESVTAAFADANAGGGKTVTLSGNFTLAGTSAGNYVLSAQPASATGTIEKKEVTVKTGSAMRAYDGTPLTCSEASITGLVPGEKTTVIAKGSQTDVGSSTNTYEIAWDSALATNYEVTKEDLGTLTVTPAPEPDPVTENVIETNTETVTNLDGSTTTIVTSKETDSSGKLVKESNTSTTNFLDGSKKVSESKTPETDGNEIYSIAADGKVTKINGGASGTPAIILNGIMATENNNLITYPTLGSVDIETQPSILIAQGDEKNLLFNTTTEKNPQGEVTATSASLTVKQTGGADGATGKSKPTQIAINAGGGVNPNAPTSGKFGNFTWKVSKSDASSSVYDVLTISGSGQMDDMIEVSPWDAYHNQIKTVILESVISEEDNMEGVTSIGVMAFNGCSSLKSVTIPQSVTSIGQLAFYGCSSLTSVTIPAGVTSIGESAFSGCSSLTSVTIPAGVTSIGQSAFNGCSAMTSLTFAEGSQLQTIGKYAFDGLTSLTSDIILPAGVTSMGKGAFAKVSENTTVGISITAAAGSRLTAINTYAFNGANASIDLSNCSKLKAIGSDLVFSQVSRNVTLPSSVTSICQYAFGNQYSTHYPGKHVYVTVPDGKKLKVTIAGVTDPVEFTPTNGKADIIDCLFDDRAKRIASRALTLKIVDASTGGEGTGGDDGGDNGGGDGDGGDNPSGKCGDNVTWKLSMSEGSNVYDVLTITGSGKMDGSPWKAYKDQIKTVTIGQGVMSICDWAFFGCSSLASVTIPASVTSIGDMAFFGCSSLTSVNIPDGVTSIGIKAFNGCSSLKSVTIPAGVTSIGESAFRDCSAMKSLTFAEGSQLQTISYSAFNGLTSLTSDIILPASVTSIGISAFSSVSNNTTDGIHVYITVPDGKKLKVMIADVTDPVEFTPTNGKADIIDCLFANRAKRIASRALTLEIVDASTGGDNGGGSASGQGQESSAREKNDRAATTMTVNFETKKVNEHASPTVPSQITVNGVTFWVTSINHLFGRSRAATAEQEEDDEIEIVSGQEYELLHDGYVVLNFYTPDAPITVNSIVFRRPGDANNDGFVDAADLVEMINAKNGHASERFNLANADIDRDGTITQDDIDAVVKMIME